MRRLCLKEIALFLPHDVVTSAVVQCFALRTRSVAVGCCEAPLVVTYVSRQRPLPGYVDCGR